MKEVSGFVLLLLLAFLPAAAQAQVCAPHPSDPGAVLIGSYTSTVELSTSWGLSGKGTKKGTKCVVANLICVFRTSNGRIDLVSDPASVTFSGDCQIENLKMAELYNLLGRAAVSDAARLGYAGCTTDCTSGTPVRFMTASCVSRESSRNEIHLFACTQVQCVRAYKICCPNGAPTIEEVPSENSGCSSVPAACESTCASSAGGASVQ